MGGRIACKNALTRREVLQTGQFLKYQNLLYKTFYNNSPVSFLSHLASINYSTYSLYYAEACKKLAGPISASLPLRASNFMGRNVAAMASLWQQTVLFYRTKNRISDLQLQKRASYRPTNWPIGHQVTYHSRNGALERNNLKFLMFDCIKT